MHDLVHDLPTSFTPATYFENTIITFEIADITVEYLIVGVFQGPKHEEFTHGTIIGKLSKLVVQSIEKIGIIEVHLLGVAYERMSALII